jgi:hypothetical protein
MTIKNLYPTSRPTLDLNFAATKRLDPRITFTRASTATFVGADGLIQSAATNAARFDHNPATGESLGLLVEEARTNIETNSEFFKWTVTSGFIQPCATVDPAGTFRASRLGATSQIDSYNIPNHSPPTSYSSNWSLTFFAKPATAGTSSIQFGQAGTGRSVTFTFATKAFTGSSVYTSVASYVELPNDLQEYEFP